MTIQYVSIHNDTDSTVEVWWVLSNTGERTGLLTISPGSRATQVFLSSQVDMDHEVCVILPGTLRNTQVDVDHEYKNGLIKCEKVWVQSNVRHVTHQFSEIFRLPRKVPEPIPELPDLHSHQRKGSEPDESPEHPKRKEELPESVPVSPPGSPSKISKLSSLRPHGNRLKYLIIVVLVVAFLMLVLRYQKFQSSQTQMQDFQDPTQQEPLHPL